MSLSCLALVAFFLNGQKLSNGLSYAWGGVGRGVLFDHFCCPLLSLVQLYNIFLGEEASENIPNIYSIGLYEDATILVDTLF